MSSSGSISGNVLKDRASLAQTQEKKENSPFDYKKCLRITLYVVSLILVVVSILIWAKVGALSSVNDGWGGIMTGSAILLSWITCACSRPGSQRIPESHQAPFQGSTEALQKSIESVADAHIRATRARGERERAQIEQESAARIQEINSQAEERMAEIRAKTERYAEKLRRKTERYERQAAAEREEKRKAAQKVIEEHDRRAEVARGALNALSQNPPSPQLVDPKQSISFDDVDTTDVAKRASGEQRKKKKRAALKPGNENGGAASNKTDHLRKPIFGPKSRQQPAQPKSSAGPSFSDIDTSDFDPTSADIARARVDALESDGEDTGVSSEYQAALSELSKRQQLKRQR